MFRVSAGLQFFDKVNLYYKACDVLYHMRHMLWVVVLLKLHRNGKKVQIFNASYVEYDIIKHFAAFCQHSVPFLPKKGQKHEFLFRIRRNGLTTCYL